MSESIRSRVPQERVAPHSSGMLMLPVLLVGLCSSTSCIVFGGIRLYNGFSAIGSLLLTFGILCALIFCVLLGGFRVVGPNQALVLTLFGRYFGTLKEPGFYHVNPFSIANAPAARRESAASIASVPGNMRPTVRTSATSVSSTRWS